MTWKKISLVGVPTASKPSKKGVNAAKRAVARKVARILAEMEDDRLARGD